VEGTVVNMLGHHLNKPVLVSSPSIFSTAEPRHCQMVGVESAGVWLECEELSRIVQPDLRQPRISVFVPFTQIAFLAGAPQEPIAPPENTETKAPEARRKAAVQSSKKRRQGSGSVRRD
jgi:hypothetical protein